MRSTIADIVQITIAFIGGLIALEYGVDPTGYVVGLLVASVAAGFAAGIKGKNTP